MVLIQSALDRELLLVPVPPPGATTGEGRVATPVAAGATATAATVADGTWWGPARIAQVALAVLAILAIGIVVQIALLSRLEYRSAQVASLNSFRTVQPPTSLRKARSTADRVASPRVV